MKIPVLLHKRECYVPTTAGITGMILISIFTILFVILYIHPFLSINRPIQCNAIIIEGWLPDYSLEYAADLFFKNRYSTIFITGGPLDNGSYLKEYENFAFLGAATLKKLGVPDSVIITVPAPYSTVNRTYASACALRQWIDSTRTTICRFNLMSQSTHTRRSVLLFRRALGRNYKVGSIAVTAREYVPEFWWRSSKGVRSVIDETVAYLYALFFISFNL